MSEAAFSDEVRRELDKYGHFSMVESHAVTAGFPDIDFCVLGKDGHMELKYSDDGKPPDIRRSQVIWFKHRVAAGSEPWIFAKVMHKGEWYYLLIEGKDMLKLARARKLTKWIELARNIGMDMGKEDWRKIAGILAKKQTLMRSE